MPNALTNCSSSTDDGDKTLKESLVSSETWLQTDEEAHCDLLEQQFRLDGKQFKHFLLALTHVHSIHLQHKQQEDLPDKLCCKLSFFLAILLQIVLFNRNFQSPKRQTNNIIWKVHHH